MRTVIKNELDENLINLSKGKFERVSYSELSKYYLIIQEELKRRNSIIEENKIKIPQFPPDRIG